jgi:hypothetical protein
MSPLALLSFEVVDVDGGDLLTSGPNTPKERRLDRQSARSCARRPLPLDAPEQVHECVPR